jgi:lipopolysaccharide export system permease protein
VAIKSHGISPSRVVTPALVFAFLLSLVTVYLNDIAVSWGRSGIYRAILNASAETIYSVLEAHGSFNKNRLSIVVDDVQGSELINPHIETTSAGSGERLQIHAAKARIFVDSDAEELVFRVDTARLQFGQALVKAPHDEYRIPLASVTKKEGPGTSASGLPLRGITRALEQQNLEIAHEQSEMALEAAAQFVAGNWTSVTDPRWKSKHNDLSQSVFRRFRLQSEPWRRWANGFSCLCFVLVGAPLAIYMRKSDFWTIFAVCFLPILILYYPLLMFSVSGAKSGSLPPWFAWMGNIVMMIIGWILVRIIERH